MANAQLEQHVSYCGCVGHLITQYKAPLPNPVMYQNFLIIGLTTRVSGGSSVNPTLTDDLGNTYRHLAQINTLSSPSIANKKLDIFYLENITNAPQTVIVNYTGSGESLDQLAISEYSGVIITGDPLRVGVAAGGSATPMSVALTPAGGSSAPDLIWGFGYLDDTSEATTEAQEMFSGTSAFTVSAGERLLSADLRYLFGVMDNENETATTSQTYTMGYQNNTSGSLLYILCFKTAQGVGTRRDTSAIRCIKMHHMDIPSAWGTATATMQFPAIGNCQVMMGCSVSDFKLDPITDSQSQTWTNPGSYPGDGSTINTHFEYLLNGSVSNTNLITMTGRSIAGGGPANWDGGAPIWLFDLVGVIGYNKKGVFKGTDPGQGGSAPFLFTGGAVDPDQGSNLILIASADFDNGLAQTIISHSPGFCLDAIVSPAINTSPVDENDGVAIVYQADDTIITSIWGKNVGNAMGDVTQISAVFYGLPPEAVREQEGFRFYDDNAAEPSQTALATQDTNINKGTQQNFRVRFLTNIKQNDPPQEGLKLQYRNKNDEQWRDVN